MYHDLRNTHVEYGGNTSVCAYALDSYTTRT